MYLYRWQALFELQAVGGKRWIYAVMFHIPCCHVGSPVQVIEGCIAGSTQLYRPEVMDQNIIVRLRGAWYG
jgi:hypothetical protein